MLVGMPVTLRGQRGEQARETEAFVDELRGLVERPDRDVRRAIHDGSRAANGERRTRGRCRRGASAAELARPCGAGMSSARSAAVLAVSLVLVAVGCGTDTAATTDAVETTPPLERLGDHLPRGVHGRRDGRARRRGQADRDRPARRDPAAHRRRLPARGGAGDAPCPVQEGLGREVDGGVPVPRAATSSRRRRPRPSSSPISFVRSASGSPGSV